MGGYRFKCNPSNKNSIEYRPFVLNEEFNSIEILIKGSNYSSLWDLNNLVQGFECGYYKFIE